MLVITYSPPGGDDRAVTYMGVEFFAGIPVEIDAEANLARKVRANPHFLVEDGSGEKSPEPKRRGRPPKADGDAEDAA